MTGFPSQNGALSESLIMWVVEHNSEILFISSLTVAEIRDGVLEMPLGKWPEQLDAWFSGPQALQMLFVCRILSIGADAALVWVDLMADGNSNGRPRSSFDVIIAAIAVVSDCIVSTDNDRDIAGIEAVNPIRGMSC